MSVIFPDLLTEVRAFRAQHPAIRYVDLIALNAPPGAWHRLRRCSRVNPVPLGYSIGAEHVVPSTFQRSSQLKTFSFLTKLR